MNPPRPLTRNAYAMSSKSGDPLDTEDRCVCMPRLSEILEEEEEKKETKGEARATVVFSFFAVLDGHGGSGCAHHLSLSLARHLASEIQKDTENPENALSKAYESAESEWREEAVRSADPSGACCVSALLRGDRLVVAHVGDCRAVLCTVREETLPSCLARNRRVAPVLRTRALTSDHRALYRAEYRRVTQLGGRVENGRLNGTLAPSRAFGNVDLKDELPEQVLTATPEIQTFIVPLAEEAGKVPTSLARRATFLILASDGVWDVLGEKKAGEIVHEALVSSGGSLAAGAQALIAAANRTSGDDASAVVVLWDEGQ